MDTGKYTNSGRIVCIDDAEYRFREVSFARLLSEAGNRVRNAYYEEARKVADSYGLTGSERVEYILKRESEQPPPDEDPNFTDKCFDYICDKQGFLVIMNWAICQQGYEEQEATEILNKAIHYPETLRELGLALFGDLFAFDNKKKVTKKRSKKPRQKKR